ncbi:MAG: hypothetical protein QOK02_3798, partial [Mycobacterium sp.]|nr:hypothetical protein [Mycobacterium sp.]
MGAQEGAWVLSRSRTATPPVTTSPGDDGDPGPDP